jgi:hypothetical protein
MGVENTGSYDLDCMIAIASGDALEALILSQVSFFVNKAALAHP